MTDIRLTVQGLAVDYPTARVVDNVSFTLGNERLALVGESGSGKSMTARALMGLVRKPGVVSAERLEVLGRDVLTLSAPRLARAAPATISPWCCRTRAMH
ncbi:putative ABC transport system oligopeptide translocator [Klebsiella pneumoniae]|uniref:ABC-type dipeptide transporter n=1 Tax=Klebsiella pneumoniae TaxID=573 RepID=A0A377W650_KLEPN|nr:putative ABC transport system oligopeptide translocator [Klebsiella pneumoniae]